MNGLRRIVKVVSKAGGMALETADGGWRFFNGQISGPVVRCQKIDATRWHKVRIESTLV